MTTQDSNLLQGAWTGQSDDDPNGVATAAPVRRRPSAISRSNLVLAGVFAAGIAAIAVLHFKAGPSAATAASRDSEIKMDTLLATLSQVKNDCNSTAASSVANTFYYEAKQRQLPPDKLTINPFRLALTKAAPATAPVTHEPPPMAAPPPDPEVQALSDALKNIRDMQLQSVLTGSAGATAMISNNVLTVGQKLNGWTVVEIGPRQVVLEWKSHRHILTMK